jgi:hypothetical protein
MISKHNSKKSDRHLGAPSVSTHEITGVALTYELLFYAYVYLPIPLLLVGDYFQFNLLQSVYFVGLILWFPVIAVYKKTGRWFNYYISAMSLIFFGIIFIHDTQSLQFIFDISKHLANVGVALFFIVCRFRYFAQFLFVVIVSMTLIYIYYVNGQVSVVSGGDIGLVSTFILIMYYFKTRNLSIFLCILAFSSIIFFQGRTQIYLSSVVLLSIVIDKVRSNPSLIPPTCATLILFIIAYSLGLLDSIIYDTNFLRDIKDRAFEIGLREHTSRCYVDTFDLSGFLFGNNKELQACIESAWKSFHGSEILQYENSIVRLNEKVGFFVVVILVLIAFAVYVQLIKFNLLSLSILSIFLVRALTGDIFFFGIHDYFFHIMIIVSIWIWNPSSRRNAYYKVDS